MAIAAIEHPPLASAYSVEVSGWDHSHVFFVERSELTWSEETGKLLTLSRRLPPGAMIFVRLLQPTDGERAFPVAYEAEALFDASERSQQFRITRVSPALRGGGRALVRTPQSPISPPGAPTLDN